MIGSLGDDFALALTVLFVGMGLAALAAAGAVVVVADAALRRREGAIRRAFAAGRFLVPAAGVLMALGLDAGSQDPARPILFGAALVAAIAAVAGVVVSGKIAAEHQRAAPLDATSGRVSLGVAVVLAVGALFFSAR